MATMTTDVSQTQDDGTPGRFGPYGGQFVPETLMPALAELTEAFEAAQRAPAFAAELAGLDVTVNGFDITLGTAWTGEGVTWNSAGSRALLRTGDADTDETGDWAWTSLSRGSENAGLTVPFPGATIAAALLANCCMSIVGLLNCSWSMGVAQVNYCR